MQLQGFIRFVEFYLNFKIDNAKDIIEFILQVEGRHLIDIMSYVVGSSMLISTMFPAVGRCKYAPTTGLPKAFAKACL